MASILEKFILLFESETESAEEGADKTSDGLDDVEKKAKKADGATKDLGKSFLGTVNSAKTALASVIGFGSLSAALIGTASEIDQLGKFSERLGLNTTEVNAWGQAVARTGGSAQEFRSTLEGLSHNLSEFERTGSSPVADAFIHLGVNAFDAQGKVKPLLQILPEIADQMQGLSKQRAAEFGQKLGLDSSTILLLQRGRVEIEKLIAKQKSLGTITDEDTKIAEKFQKAWDDVQRSFFQLTAKIGSQVLPFFTMFLDKIEGVVTFLQENEAFVKGAFVGFAAVLAVAFAPIVKMGAIIAGVSGAIGLIVDDIEAFRRGNDSLIGDMMEKYPIVEELVNGIVKAFQTLKQVATEVFDYFKENSLSDAIDDVGEGIGNFFKDFSISGMFGSDEGIKAGQTALQTAGASPLAAQSSSSISNSNMQQSRSNSFSIGSVQVDARGGDSKEIAAGTKGALQKQFKQTTTEFDDGVAI